jgi:hypothetical protein
VIPDVSRERLQGRCEGVPWRRCATAFLLLLSVACSLPATTFDAYRSKAVDAAEEVVSQARTVILVADLARRDRLLGSAIPVQLQATEATAAGAVASFASMLPPDPRSDELRAEILPRLEGASDLIARMRFAARRGDAASLPSLAAALTGPTDRLERWIQAHG